ncbi:hypothetical protein X975_24119, partial [Stegodyphus mimosarum]
MFQFGPDEKTTCMLFVKFERTGSVAADRKENVGPRQTVVTPENAAKVSGIVQQNPQKSIQRTASETGLKYTSTQKYYKIVYGCFHIKSKVIKPYQ